MPDREPSHEEFAKAADRSAYEQKQLLASVSEETRRLVADMAKRAEKEKENLRREQRKRYRDDVEKQKARIRDRDRQAYRPRWAADRLTEKRIQELAAKEVQANNKTELATIDKNLQRSVDRILAAHAPEKKRQLDKDRTALKELSEQKRRDREATRLDRPADKDRSGKDAQTRREDDLRKRVAARIRKARVRDQRSQNRGREAE